MNLFVYQLTQIANEAQTLEELSERLAVFTTRNNRWSVIWSAQARHFWKKGNGYIVIEEGEQNRGNPRSTWIRVTNINNLYIVCFIAD